ncbi:MAG: 2-amino-4-hydroxy-6-hydroxymethyldihydropteridine diphosphokinase, partial [Shimia sp.]
MPQDRNPIPSGHPFVTAIALGSNAPTAWGPPDATCREAQRYLHDRLGASVLVSSIYRTAAFPAGSGPDYANAAALVATEKTASEIMSILHGIEAEAGRTRAVRWGQRTLDLDLLVHGDAVLPDAATQAAWRDLPLSRQMAQAPDRLVLPHPRVQDRAFVLVPLNDIAPDWKHP